MPWITDWMYGLPMTVVILAIHGLALAWGTEALIGRILRQRPRARIFVFGMATTASALYVVALHGFEAVLWAWLYLYVGALEGWRSAIYFSLGAMTSYGSADVQVTEEWRLLGQIEAVNGLILFGITTAFLFAVTQRLWPPRHG